MRSRAMRIATATIILAGLLATAAAAAPGGARDRDAAGGLEVREVALRFAGGGDVCWFSALLGSDYGCDGRRSLCREVRLTGLLERRDGVWVVVRLFVAADAGMRGSCGRVAY